MNFTRNKYIISVSILAFLFGIAGFNQTNEYKARVNFRETVWLQTDRQLYLPGEIISYQAVLLENDTS